MSLREAQEPGGTDHEVTLAHVEKATQGAQTLSRIPDAPSPTHGLIYHVTRNYESSVGINRVS